MVLEDFLQLLGARGGAGATPGKLIAAGAAGGDPTVIKAAPGTLKSVVAVNVNAALRYLKLYDKATAPASTDVPVHVIPLGVSATGPGCPVLPPEGLAFVNGIGFRLTTGIADNDNTAVTANDVVVSYSFK